MAAKRFCGDTSCDGGGDETTCNCPIDCPGECHPLCGDGVCESPEDCCACPGDCPGTCEQDVCVPTLSGWGMVVMALLSLSAGTVVVMRQRAVTKP